MKAPRFDISGPPDAPARTMLVLLGAAILGAASCSQRQPAASAELVGQQLYERNCASCHGAAGDGQGPAAYLLFPKPRNFQRGEFKLRSTPQGMLPTDADLVRTVTQGIPGSSMLAFGDLLTGEEISTVVDYVKSLSPEFTGADPIRADQLLEIPPAPEPTPELIAAGEEAYTALRCAQCHGPEGRGDGPSAPTLRDSEGNPFPAADFTYGIYKSGGGPEDLYRVFLTGMAGTPMPSFAEALASDEQAWALVYYLLSLGPEQPRPVTSDPGAIAVAELAVTEALEDPRAEAWDAVAPHRVVLRPLWYRNDFPPFVALRVGRNGDRIGLLLEWRDASEDTDSLRNEGFADGIALQFALSDPPPFVGMGAAGGDGAVEIWYWRADRERDRSRGALAGLPDIHPDMAVDQYPFAGPEPHDPTTAVGDLTADQEAPFIAGRDVGNPVSDPELSRRPVHGLAAAGFGTLTSRPEDAMRASGTGSWEDGVYRVLFTAPVEPADRELEADLGSGTVPVAVAVWNGSFGDRNGTKLVSQWLRLRLSAGPRASEPADAEGALAVAGDTARRRRDR